MLEQLDAIQQEALAEIPSIDNEPALEQARVKFLGKKGTLAAAGAGMRDVPKEQKKEVGQKLNEVREAITSALEAVSQSLADAKDAESVAGLDVTLPGLGFPRGAEHPLRQTLDRAVRALRLLTQPDGPGIRP